MRRASYRHRCTAGNRAAQARALLCWLSLRRRRNPLACLARARCHAGRNPLTAYGRAVHLRKSSLIRCKTLVRHASCGHRCTAGLRAAHARVLLRWLSLGRRRSPLACGACTLCRADCDAPMSHDRAVHRRKASLLRCKTLAPHANCGHRFAACFRLARAQAPLRWLSLSRRRLTRADRALALCRSGRDPPTAHERTLHRRGPSLLRCNTLMRHASCGLR